MNESNCNAMSVNDGACASARPMPSAREAVERLKKISDDSIRIAQRVYDKINGIQNCKASGSSPEPVADTMIRALDYLGDENARLRNILENIDKLL